MLARRRVLLPLIVCLALAGTGLALWLARAPEPLAPLAVETLAPPTGIALPHHVVGGGDSGTEFTLDSPADGTTGGDALVIVPLAEAPEFHQVGITWFPASSVGSIEELTDHQRRDPESSQLVGDVVIEHSSLGAAYRKDLVMSETLTITQWAVEHDDDVYLVEWVHGPSHLSSRPVVEAMIDSWRWS